MANISVVIIIYCLVLAAFLFLLWSIYSLFKSREWWPFYRPDCYGIMLRKNGTCLFKKRQLGINKPAYMTKRFISFEKFGIKGAYIPIKSMFEIQKMPIFWFIEGVYSSFTFSFPDISKIVLKKGKISANVEMNYSAEKAAIIIESEQLLQASKGLQPKSTQWDWKIIAIGAVLIIAIIYIFYGKQLGLRT